MVNRFGSGERLVLQGPEQDHRYPAAILQGSQALAKQAVPPRV